jgi:predicted nucleotidyltransferase
VQVIDSVGPTSRSLAQGEVISYDPKVSVKPEDLARTLVRRHAEERRRAESRAQELRAGIRHTIAEAISRGIIRRAWLVGSLAWGGFDRTSDVDLVVEGLCSEKSSTMWDQLSAELGVRVDLLRLESLPPGFTDRVRSEGVPLHVS